jgi:hypothetical protein
MSNNKELHELVRSLIRDYIESRKLPEVILTDKRPSTPGLVKPGASISLSSVTTTSSVQNVIDGIDLDRLRAGLEYRTTLMIKRIPRKYTLSTLRAEIDRVTGESNIYDLLYLPVDSAKMTNRGYAFINFTKSDFVELFVRKFLNREWSELNKRGKTALVCWANVQGRDATLSHIKTIVGSQKSN